MGDLKQLNANTFANNKVNPCCQQEGNLYLAHQDDENKLVVWRCKTCRRNHYVVEAEPGNLRFVGKEIH